MKLARWNKQAIYLLGASLLLSACAVLPRQHPGGGNARQDKGMAAQERAVKSQVPAADQIIFLTMSIADAPHQGVRTITVQDLVKTPGTLKTSLARSFQNRPHLSCILYAGSLRLDSINLEHPLFKQVEYVNEQNQLHQKAIKLDQAEFYIRFQPARADQLKIEERLPGTQPKTLLTIKF
jgi:hypothetical protein